MSLTTAQEFEIEVAEDPAKHSYFDASAGLSVFKFSVVVYGGWLLNPSGSTAAAGAFYDGNDTTGNPDLPFYVAANTLLVPALPHRGVLFLNGVYVNLTAGEVKGSLFYRRVWKR